MSAADIVLRDARPTDAEAIARLHVAVWRATYRGLAPAEAVRILDVPYRLARWREMLAAGSDRTILVAETESGIVAIGTCGAPSVPALGSRGEINYLYVDPALAGRGIGRRLMQALALRLEQRGYRSAALGVVEGNTAAIAFYERIGGRRIGHYTDPGPHWRSGNAIYAWDDLAALIAAGERG